MSPEIPLAPIASGPTRRARPARTTRPQYECVDGPLDGHTLPHSGRWPVCTGGGLPLTREELLLAELGMLGPSYVYALGFWRDGRLVYAYRGEFASLATLEALAGDGFRTLDSITRRTVRGDAPRRQTARRPPWRRGHR